MFGILQPLFGAMVILAIGVLFSTNRRAINWKTIAWGLGLLAHFSRVRAAFGRVIRTDGADTIGAA